MGFRELQRLMLLLALHLYLKALIVPTVSTLSITITSLVAAQVTASLPVNTTPFLVVSRLVQTM